MTPTRRSCAAALAISLLGLGAVACGDDDSARGGETQPMTLMLNWTPNTHHIGVYVAEQRGWYADAGIDLRIIEPASGGAPQALAAGRADIGISMAEEILPARAAGIPVVSVATILPHNDSSLMSLADAGITRPRDLEGKTYGGYGGPLETELISQLVECDGGDPAKVEMIQIGDADYLAGLDRDLFDVVWVFSGWDAMRANEVAKNPVNEIRFDDYFDCIPDWYTPLFMASEATIADRSDMVRTFLAVTARGYTAAIDDPAAAAADFLAAVPEADEALVETSARYHAGMFVDDAVGPWGTQEAKVWTDFEAFALEAGLLTEPVDPAAAFTNDLLPG